MRKQSYSNNPLIILFFLELLISKPYRGGELRTRQDYRYGRFEVRMQSAQGDGVVSSFFTYRDYWARHWLSLYNIDQEDTAQNHMFFDKPWSEVSEKEIKKLAEKLGKEMGGWIFHQKIDWSAKTPHVEVNHSAKDFLEK